LNEKKFGLAFLDKLNINGMNSIKNLNGKNPNQNLKNLNKIELQTNIRFNQDNQDSMQNTNINTFQNPNLNINNIINSNPNINNNTNTNPNQKKFLTNFIKKGKKNKLNTLESKNYKKK
jgi:hypothetical protein